MSVERPNEQPERYCWLVYLSKSASSEDDVLDLCLVTGTEEEARKHLRRALRSSPGLNNMCENRPLYASEPLARGSAQTVYILVVGPPGMREGKEVFLSQSAANAGLKEFRRYWGEEDARIVTGTANEWLDGRENE